MTFIIGEPCAQLKIVGSASREEERMNIGGQPAILPFCTCHLWEHPPSHSWNARSRVHMYTRVHTCTHRAKDPTNTGKRDFLFTLVVLPLLTPKPIVAVFPHPQTEVPVLKVAHEAVTQMFDDAKASTGARTLPASRGYDNAEVQVRVILAPHWNSPSAEVPRRRNAESKGNPSDI